ncbi:hypothetical protein SAMD00023353_10300030 [Rosellinia necatrix]|uniref:NmrA-like domain-containing protein n=1 Tax=Rosellinia necatrix TaxID=77044 RepID=A0A1W2TXM8_ROSNE|nr:hypothetical protein SAMD00023353_10300030 [Rosellinia necatrix]
MAPTPTILIAGATGNTGRSVVETLSKLRSTDGFVAGHRILALTRTATSAAARALAGLPGVEVEEQNWQQVDAAWLRARGVVRAFVASAVGVSQFTEESTFLVAALEAGVGYVVRISTTAPNVRPDCGAFYARMHWALEALLASPEFAARGLRWTSLQPNSFSPLYLRTAADLVKQHRATGTQGLLRILGTADTPVGIVDPYDVGVLAARLLAQEDTAPHNGARYIVNGPEDITGNQIVAMVEKYIGTKVENVSFGDMSFIDAWAERSGDHKIYIMSIKHSLAAVQKGLCPASTTSKEVLQLAPPTRTAAETFASMLEE